MNVQQGQSAPDFVLPSFNGDIRLSDLKGKWVIIYFYPRDNTPGCSKQAQEFAKEHVNLDDDIMILGVSKDSIDSHSKFSDKYELPFELLSDEDTKVCESFGAWGEKKFLGKTYTGIIRSTFLIDPDGIISHTWYNVRVSGHVDEVMSVLRRNISKSKQK